MTGHGLLVLPDPDADVDDPLQPMGSLHAVDWRAMTAELDRAGWELLLGDGDGWVSVSLGLGRPPAIALFGRESINSNPPVHRVATSEGELIHAAIAALT